MQLYAEGFLGIHDYCPQRALVMACPLFPLLSPIVFYPSFLPTAKGSVTLCSRSSFSRRNVIPLHCKRYNDDDPNLNLNKHKYICYLLLKVSKFSIVISVNDQLFISPGIHSILVLRKEHFSVQKIHYLN